MSCSESLYVGAAPSQHTLLGIFPESMAEHRQRTQRRGAVLSPLRYPGSKRRLAGYIKDLLDLHGLHPKLFVEPFAGGASVALQLLHDGTVDSVGLMDKDPLVAAFWKTVFRDTDWLITQIETIEVTLEKWLEFKQTIPRDRRQLAIACLFLNRTSFSGNMSPTAGPLGGKAQTSEYRIDCRFSREMLIERVKHAASFKNQVAFVWNADWQRGLRRLSQKQHQHQLSDDVFFYFDPPFFEKAERLYTHFFVDHDHKQLRNKVKELQYPWILSYDAPERVKKLYGVEHGASHVELFYTMSRGKRSIAKEVVISSLPTVPGGVKLWGTHKSQERCTSQLLLSGNT